jgi:excisionase family DNA binding protein
MGDNRVTTGQAAKVLGLSGQTIRKLIRKGELDAIETKGGKFRVTQASIEAYIAARQVRPASQPEAAR